MHNAFVRSIADMLVEFLRVDLNSSMRNNNTLKKKTNGCASTMTKMSTTGYTDIVRGYEV